jgi:trimethylamine--corrinoid protein Co-methyltransferase
MKTGGYLGSPPEQFLINTTNLQLALDRYHLPTRSMCGMTESKMVDCQAGYETMQNLMMGMLSGAHIIHECVGILDSIMTVSYEKTMIDQELLERMMCFTSGITDISDNAFAVDTIHEVGHNGTYLTHPDTFKHVRDRWQPSVSNWDTYDLWEKNGSHDVAHTANTTWKTVLSSCPDTLIEPELDHELKCFLAISSNNAVTDNVKHDSLTT